MIMQQEQQDAYNLGVLAGQAPIQRDIYTWRVVYDDDCTAIYENAENSFADVDPLRVKTLLLLPLEGTECEPQHIDIPHGAQAVFFRRRSIEINPLAEESSPRPTVHCIGWKRGDEAIYLFVFDNGSTLLTDNLQAV